MKRRVAILISGRGSNMAALIDAAKAADFPAEIVAVISNRADAPGLEKAAASGIPTTVIASKPFGKDRAGFEVVLQRALEEQKVELICLGGFMRLFTAEFVQRWYGKMLNIHPSLLPAYPGLNTHAQALADGVKVHGCTVHFVTQDVDHGPIIAQAAVAVHEDDDEPGLAARVLRAEHRILVAAVRWFCDDRLVIDGNRVRVKHELTGADTLLVPALQ